MLGAEEQLSVIFLIDKVSLFVRIIIQTPLLELPSLVFIPEFWLSPRAVVK